MLLIHLDEFEATLSNVPAYQLHALFGMQGSQPTYFEMFTRCHVKGSVHAFNVPEGALRDLIFKYASGQEIGAARIGIIIFKEVRA
jgi:hypothetical protein